MLSDRDSARPGCTYNSHTLSAPLPFLAFALLPKESVPCTFNSSRVFCLGVLVDESDELVSFAPSGADVDSMWPLRASQGAVSFDMFPSRKAAIAGGQSETRFTAGSAHSTGHNCVQSILYSVCSLNSHSSKCCRTCLLSDI